MGWKGIGLREEQGWEDSEVSRGGGGLLSRHRLALLDVFVVSVYMIIDFVCGVLLRGYALSRDWDSCMEMWVHPPAEASDACIQARKYT